MKFLVSLCLIGVAASLKMYAPSHFEEEVQSQMGKLFHKFDKNKDGTLSLKEFSKFIAREVGPDVDAKEVFDKLCTDGDGKMTLEEFQELDVAREQGEEASSEQADEGTPQATTQATPQAQPEASS